MKYVRQQPPGWFWVVAALLLLWALAGCAAYYFHMAVDAKALAAMSPYDRTYFQNLPGWFGYVFALAVLPALAGAVALLMRSKLARPFYLVSLIGVIVQFGWVLGATDLIAVKGIVTAAGFPLVIFVLAVVQVWFSTVARRRGWLM